MSLQLFQSPEPILIRQHIKIGSVQIFAHL
jgi:hypothetical protein